MLCENFAGMYFSGDGARRHDGEYYQITGRMDDVINTSGHRLGTAELEDVIVSDCWYKPTHLCYLLPSMTLSVEVSQLH